MTSRRQWVLSVLELTVILALSVGTAMLTGCQTTPPPTVTVTKYVVVRPSADLLKPCVATAVPPDPKTYPAASHTEKEKQLFEFGATAQGDLATCNSRWPVLIKWFDLQEKNYAQPAVPPK